MNGIKCVKCGKKIAEVICSCRELPLCKKHFGEHIMTEGNHSYKNIYFELGISQKSHLFQSCITKIKMINSIKYKIQADTVRIIKSIEDLKISAFQVLNQDIKKIQKILNYLSKKRLSKVEYKNSNEMIGAKWGIYNHKEIDLGNEFKDYYQRNFYYDISQIQPKNFNTKLKLKPESTKSCNKTFCFDPDYLEQNFIRPMTPNFNKAQRLGKNPIIKKVKNKNSEKQPSIKNTLDSQKQKTLRK